MSSLNKLKLVASKPVRAVSAVQHRRNKLAAKITEQIQLATAQRDGRAYTATRLKTVRDPNTGHRTVLETAKHVRELYWAGDTGKVHLALRYGAKLRPGTELKAQERAYSSPIWFNPKKS